MIEDKKYKATGENSRVIVYYTSDFSEGYEL